MPWRRDPSGVFQQLHNMHRFRFFQNPKQMLAKFNTLSLEYANPIKTLNQQEERKDKTGPWETTAYAHEVLSKKGF